MVSISDVDKDTRDFLYNWLQNNSAGPSQWWRSDHGLHDLSSVEERLLQLETDKDSLQLQVNVLEDQVDSQTNRVGDLERSLRDKQGEVRRLEEIVGMERNKRTVSEKKCDELRTEAAALKLKCARLERDLNELRNTTPKLPRPSNLGPGAGLPRSPTPVSSPDDVSPTSKKGVIFSEEETDQGGNNDGAVMETSMVSLSGRSTRGLRKIFGKIKRSNSGGFDSDRAEGGFTRGGVRATVSGRLGWSQLHQQQQVMNKNKRFADWSVDILCSWLETIGQLITGS